jgi:hypothetical protein
MRLARISGSADLGVRQTQRNQHEKIDSHYYMNGMNFFNNVINNANYHR